MSMSDVVRRTFTQQAEACEKLGSPFTARLCRLAARNLSEGGAVADVILNWPGDASARGDAVALRFMGALHGLVLEKRNAPLAAVYPPHHLEVSDPVLWAAVEGALSSEAEFILHRLQNAPQTNEVRRAAALLPMFLEISALTRLPLTLSEVGASAGLNLFLDKFHIELGAQSWGNPASTVTLAPKWHGEAAPVGPLDIVARGACDLRPSDPSDVADRMRLLSFIWADQADRLARTRAAIEIAAAGDARVEAADALLWLQKRTARPMPGTAHVIYSTIAWQYLPAAARAEGEAIIRAAGARATENAPLAWARMEVDGESPGTGLTLTLWPTGEEHLV
ncbi:MAG: DUF2332 family protein, partial [Alphaproteobacteria bacterium]